MAQFLYRYIRTVGYGTVPVLIHPNSQLWYNSCTNTTPKQEVMAHFLQQNKSQEKDLIAML